MQHLNTKSPLETLVHSQSELLCARTPQSAERYERARAVFPGGETRAAAFFAPHPVQICDAEQAELRDIDGNAYVDFTFNYGAIVLGHCHEAVVDAATGALRSGASFAAPGPDQIELAETLLGRLANAERLRFVTSGTEANTAALRAARAFTGRDVVVKAIGGFHGTVSELDRDIRGSQMPRGVPADSSVVAVPYNDLAALTRAVSELGERCAAVILEPILYSGGVVEGTSEFLHGAARAAAAVGALFLLDEVATFRLAPGGLQGVLGLKPDITTLGKIIGGGFPVGALAGRDDVMEVYDLRRPGAIQHSGTYNGNPVTVAAGRAVMERLTESAYADLADSGASLADGLRNAIVETGAPAQVTRAGSLVNIHFTRVPLHDFDAVHTADAVAAAAFHLGLLNRGVFAAPRGLFITSLATGPVQIEQAVAAAHATLSEIASRCEERS